MRMKRDSPFQTLSCPGPSEVIEAEMSGKEKV
jgi:hypothetical protein